VEATRGKPCQYSLPPPLPLPTLAGAIKLDPWHGIVFPPLPSHHL
jgi:hypothetical protein